MKLDASKLVAAVLDATVTEDTDAQRQAQTPAPAIPAPSPDDDIPDARDALKAVTGDGGEEVENPPFANYIEVDVEKGKKPKKIPVPIDRLTRDIRDRLDDFPRRLGSTLFYFDPSAAKKPIRTLERKSDLFAWLMGEGHCLIQWATGPGFVTQDQLFARIYDKARYYDATSAAPYYPDREDVFPTFGELPTADPEHRAFWKLVGRFNPADDANRTILAAFIVTPIWYDGINDRPMCLVDTDDAQGSGKTTVVKMISRLYDQHAEAEYIDIDIRTLGADDTKIKKEILSAEGRSKRIVLFDNLTKTIKSEALAKLVTGGKVSGMAPYGHGTETRPADFTFYGTMNGASTDEDMTTRTYTLRIKSVEDPDPQWENDTVSLIRDNRLQILADILDMMKKAVPRRRKHKSRFGVYDSTVLSAVCLDDAEFEAADNALAEASGNQNEDAELALDFLTRFEDALAKSDEYIPDTPVVVTQSAIDWLLANSSGDLAKLKSKHIRNLIKAGHLPNFSKEFDRLTACDRYQGHRERAFFFGMKMGGSAHLPGETTFEFVSTDGSQLKPIFRETMKRPNS